MRTALTVAIAVLLLVLWSSGETAMAVPQLPLTLYGAVTVGGSPAPDGLPVEARVEGTNFAVSVGSGGVPQTKNGSFGANGADDFQVRADDTDAGTTGAVNGQRISFFVDGVEASVTVVSNPNDPTRCPGVTFPAVGSTVATYPFCVGGVAEFDLAIDSLDSSPPDSGPSGPPFIPPAAATATPTPSPTPTPTLTPTASPSPTPTAMPELIPSATPSPAPTSPAIALTPTPVPPRDQGQEGVGLEVETTSTVTQEQADVANEVLNAALGLEKGSTAAVQVMAGQVIVSGVEPGRVRARLSVGGLTSKGQIEGPIGLTVGSVTVDTLDGEGTGVIQIGRGLRIEGEVGLVARDGALNIVFVEPRLVVEPEMPSELAEGNADLGHASAAFEVEILSLSNDAGLEIEFANEASGFVPEIGAVLAVVAKQVADDGGIGPGDVAFAVRVTRRNLSNASLGDSTATFTVSAGWLRERQTDGKAIAIAKVSDDGRVFSEQASCEVGSETAVCEATFAGVMGGFSTFMLVAVQPGVNPTATPAVQTPTIAALTPTPTVPASAPPTPTAAAIGTTDSGTIGATPTGTAAPVAGQGGVVGFVLVALALVGAAGAVGVMVLERGRSGR